MLMFIIISSCGVLVVGELGGREVEEGPEGGRSVDGESVGGGAVGGGAVGGGAVGEGAVGGGVGDGGVVEEGEAGGLEEEDCCSIIWICFSIA
jgi:hypothetical protein